MIQYNITKTDAGQTGLLGCSVTSAPLWIDEREKILTRIGKVKGYPEIGTVVYTLSYHSKTEWVIRRIEIITSIDSRDRSNITTSLIIPALCNKKGQQIIDIFDTIKQDICNKCRVPSDKLNEKLQRIDKTTGEWTQISPQNNRFGIKRFADAAELINLLDHIWQKEYAEYQTIYFIPTSCVLHPDENYVQLLGGVDERKTMHLEKKDIVDGITFTPEVFSRSFFKSEIDQIKIKWSSNGFKTIVKSISDTTISTSEIFHEVKLNDLFSVSPNDANVSCSIDGKSLECNNGIIYVPYGRIKDCKFIISKQGYTSVEHKYLESRQSIRLEEKLITLQPEFKTTDCRKRVKVQLKMSEFSEHGAINSDNIIICSSDYFSKLEKAQKHPSLKKVLFSKITLIVLCTSLLLGGLFGAYGVHYYHKKHPITVEKKGGGEQVYSNNSTKDSVEDYLASNIWTETKISDLNGLFKAMDRFSYEDIKKKYNNLKQTYDIGKLQEVIDEINLHNNIKKPKADYTTMKKTNNIDISAWIEMVKNENSVAPPEPPKQSSDTYVCKYRCGKSFKNKTDKNNHEKECEGNPANQDN